MKKKVIFIPLIVLLFIFGIYLWWAFSKHQTPQSIILVSLDTLRADHLGIYGYHRDTSPYIDSFGEENIMFSNAVVQSAWTLPSHVSIMTSLYPYSHGASKREDHFVNEHVSLAELLQERGYKTAAFTDGGYISKAFGFEQGFDIFDDQGGGIVKILPKVKKWLEGNDRDPFFLFVHCYDIHSPYNPPPPYNSMFHDFSYKGSFVPTNNNLRWARNKKITLSDLDLRHVIAFYDGGIRYTDEKIGEFLSYLKDTGLYDQSLIIITSDHGEEFMEHGSYLHWQLYYRPNLHVPLIMHIPYFSKKGIVIDDLVESIDIFPTVLDILGLKPYLEAQGRSLLPLIKRDVNSLYRLMNNFLHSPDKEPPASFAEENRDTSSLSIITRDGYQMVRDLNSNHDQLFNLNKDPLAQNDIAEDHNAIIEHLLSTYQELNMKKLHTSSTLVQLNSQTQAQLVALGYIDSPDDLSMQENTDFDNDGLPDDKDNCSVSPNPNQEDGDKDGTGDACDNCLKVANADQNDLDGDFIGDACDKCVDIDWDGYGNPGFPQNQCSQDNCPTIFNPDQKDLDGNGMGNACEPAQYEYHWLEAENTDTIINPLKIANNKNASGDKYIYSPNGTGNHYKPGSIMATYTVNIAEAGDYILWGLVNAVDLRDNSFFVQIDNGVDNVWEIALGSQWHWDQVNNRNKEDPARFTLPLGLHTIKVKLREDGTELDKILLTNNVVFIPTNQGDIAGN